MISKLRNTPPYITFGFGKTEITIAADIPVTVWLSEQYNEAEYHYSITANGASANEKVSNYQYELTYSTPGTYSLFAILTGRGTQTTKGKELTSNILTLTVI